MKTIRFISFLLFVAFLPACDKNDGKNDYKNDVSDGNIVIDYSKVKSRVTVDAATGDETREFYSFDAEGKQTGYEKYVNNNRITLYTNYRYGDKSLTYDQYEGAYSYEVAYVFYKDDYDTQKYTSKTITNVITGKKESDVYEYDSIGRPIWYEHTAVTGYTYGYPAFFKYFYPQSMDGREFNFDKIDYRYDGLTLTIEPQTNKYEVGSLEWENCRDSLICEFNSLSYALVRDFLERRPRCVIRFYDETFTKIVSVERIANDYVSYSIQNEFDLKGNPIKEESSSTTSYYTYDVDGRLIGYDCYKGDVLTRRSNYVYDGKKLTYDERKYKSDSGEKVSESRAYIEFY